MTFKRFAFFLTTALIFNSAHAGTANTTALISTTVAPDCLLSATVTSSLPDYFFSRTAITGSFSIIAKCNKDTGYTLSLADGATTLNNATATAITLSGPDNTAPLNAQLNLAALAGAKTATGIDQSYSVPVTVPSNQAVPLGSYSKTLTVNLTYDDSYQC